MTWNTEQLLSLSDGLAAVAARAAESVVRVEGRRRAGSGVAWAADAILTAAHAVGEEDEVEVQLPSGEAVRGEVAGRDPGTDLAVVRLASPATLPLPAWHDDVPAAGSLALTLSRPGRAPRAGLALVARVSAGEWRAPGGARLDRFVELDASLFPGFSGGLVVDLAGRALGLANAGVVRGAALALPPATLRRVAGALLSHGAVRRGYLGVATIPVHLPSQLRTVAGQERGLLVSGLDEGGPAAQVGVVLGDVLLSAAGSALAHPRDLAPLLEEDRIGEPLPLRVLRAGAPRDLALTIGARGGRS